MDRLSSSRLGRVGMLGAVLVMAGVVACASETVTYEDIPDDAGVRDGGFDSRPQADSGLGELTFRPNVAYSGYDGTNSYIVPIAVYDSADDLEVDATDPSAVEITRKQLANPVRNDGATDNGKYFFVAIKKPGTITLQAKSSGRTTEATINVETYTPARWSAGETRYLNPGTPAEDQPACKNCHQGGQAIDHSPAALATADDAKVGIVITQGISTAGNRIRIGNQPGHAWKVDPTEKDGLVTYLRSLEPRGFK